MRLLLLLVLSIFFNDCWALLKVIDSDSREFKTLDGFWNFIPDYTANSVNEEWWVEPLEQHGEVQLMPVPSSFNDIYTDAKLRDHLGWVWYETYFSTPTLWLNSSKQYDSNYRKIFLRFESAHYYAMVFVNGEFVMDHVIGHLPFEVEVGAYLRLDQMNRLTVALNNTLNSTTIPPSAYNYMANNSYYIYPEGYVEVDWQFGFFNYAGIHRPVKLYTTPAAHVNDVTIKTTPIDTGANLWNLTVTVDIDQPGSDENLAGSYDITLGLLDRSGTYSLLGSVESGIESSFQVEPEALWWPYTMHEDFGALVTLKVEVVSKSDGETVDVYNQKFGFRHVTWTNTSFYINGIKTYLTGINKHEDADIRGKGLDYALIGRDFANQKWLGSNAFRTSHYPYAEEYLEMADQLGIMVIGECPGAGIQAQNLLNETLKVHKQSIVEMISRDKNHPAIIMWSLANEPDAEPDAAEQYFKDLFESSRPLDDTRPYTFVSDQMFDTVKAFQFCDFLNINRYIGWYQDLGMNQWMTEEVYHYVKNYHLKFNKPVIMQEYGAGTLEGYHKLPASPYNEEYQVNVLNWTGMAFDRMREEFLVGEFIWNYADFLTNPDIERPDGNKKGIFTRERQPKMSAHFLRNRYQNIISQHTRLTKPKLSSPTKKVVYV